eukprot:gnl/Carplike_NY0171/1870_a2537_436.p1 GENE.gnl/Carplike_NY0171/1870_a2537_436~~gnl/Carplike_NY0171/1870_a2537_436.p1  ORF type:complete len:478 (+),score=111.46 gnl/Carplike_NY0171/1870_a2537_436:1-1434(+)
MMSSEDIEKKIEDETGWRRYFDPANKRNYYYNSISKGASVWLPPGEFVTKAKKYGLKLNEEEKSCVISSSEMAELAEAYLLQKYHDPTPLNRIYEWRKVITQYNCQPSLKDGKADFLNCESKLDKEEKYYLFPSKQKRSQEYNKWDQAASKLETYKKKFIGRAKIKFHEFLKKFLTFVRYDPDERKSFIIKEHVEQKESFLLTFSSIEHRSSSSCTLTTSETPELNESYEKRLKSALHTESNDNIGKYLSPFHPEFVRQLEDDSTLHRADFVTPTVAAPLLSLYTASDVPHGGKLTYREFLKHPLCSECIMKIIVEEVKKSPLQKLDVGLYDESDVIKKIKEEMDTGCDQYLSYTAFASPANALPSNLIPFCMVLAETLREPCEHTTLNFLKKIHLKLEGERENARKLCLNVCEKVLISIFRNQKDSEKEMESYLKLKEEAEKAKEQPKSEELKEDKEEEKEEEEKEEPRSESGYGA